MKTTTCDDLLGKMDEVERARVARTRTLMDEELPILGALVDEKFPRRDGEPTADHNQRQADLLILAAYALFSNTTDKGHNVGAFAEYVQGIASSAVLAAGGDIAVVPDPKSRIHQLGKMLADELVFGEEYALVLFSLDQTAWKTSARGELGIDMLESAAKSIRAHENERQKRTFTITIESLFDRAMGKVDDEEEGEDEEDDEEDAPAKAPAEATP